jgi:hypothetical protein
MRDLHVSLCDLEVIDTSSRLRLIRKVPTLSRVFPTLDLNCEENTTRWNLGLLVDSEIVLSIRYGKTMVFINKTLSTETVYQQDLINRDLLSTRLIVGITVGKVGSGMWCGKFKSTWCVCVLFVHLLEDDLRCLFSPNQVNHGDVQKTPAHVSLYKSHMTEEPLRRRRSDRYYQVLSNHSGQVGKLLLMLIPPHQRVCVVGHLLDLHARLKVGFPFDRGHVEIHGCGTHTQEFVQITTMLDLSIRVLHFSLRTLYVKTFQVHGKITGGSWSAPTVFYRSLIITFSSV